MSRYNLVFGCLGGGDSVDIVDGVTNTRKLHGRDSQLLHCNLPDCRGL
jgi:hypothetical protein